MSPRQYQMSKRREQVDESRRRVLDAARALLREGGQMSGLAGAFTDPRPMAALREFVMVFGRFWAVDRTVMRRLRALAALDPDAGAVVAARDARRLQGLTVLLSRFDGNRPESVTRMLYALTSFETYDALAGPDGDLAAVAPLVADLAFAALGLANRADIAANDPHHSRAGQRQLRRLARCASGRSAESPGGMPAGSRAAKRANTPRACARTSGRRG
jgi:hypothetical protein